MNRHAKGKPGSEPPQRPYATPTQEPVNQQRGQQAVSQNRAVQQEASTLVKVRRLASQIEAQPEEG